MLQRTFRKSREMTKICIPRKLFGLSRSTDLFLLAAVLWQGVPAAIGQSALTVKVETYHGSVVTSASVALKYYGSDDAVRKLAHIDDKDEKALKKKEKHVIDVLNLAEKEMGRYSADRLRGGFYELTA